MSLTNELGVSAGVDHFGHCSSDFPPSRILIQNHSLAYRGALEVVCVPKGSEWSLTLSDVPNPRAPTRIGPGGPHVFNQADGSWGPQAGARRPSRGLGDAHGSIRLASRNAAVSAYGRRPARIAGVVEGKAGSSIVVLRP
jgi:hypothetical protein